MSRILECCVDSARSALTAAQNGASRLELCANLIIGGTTPTLGLFREIRKCADIPVHVLLRPRFGDFLYDSHEVSQLCEEAVLFREEGADGIVIGALNEEGYLDLPAMEKILSQRGSMLVTLHRAFDVCRDPMRTLEEAKALGINTILTSGQQENCLEGRELIKELCRNAGNVQIMAGGGVDAGVIRTFLLEKIPVGAFHMSGKIRIESGMKFRREGVPMGLKNFSEFEQYVTSGEKVREARTVLDKFSAC